MKQTTARLICLLALLGLVQGCSNAETPKVTPITVTLRVASDAAIHPLMQALTRAYTDKHPHVAFTLVAASTPAATDAIYSKRVDIAAVSLLPEKIAGREAPWMADLATDGVAVIVNPANPLDGLSLQQLRDIYAGVYNGWDGLGAAGIGDLHAAVREGGDGTRVIFDRAVMGSNRLTLNAVVLPSIEVVMNFVAYQPGAIGYVPSARITDTVSPPVKVLAIDGQPPAKETLLERSYLLSRSLYLIATSEPQGDLRDFVAWVLSPEGQRVVDAANYATVPGALSGTR